MKTKFTLLTFLCSLIFTSYTQAQDRCGTMAHLQMLQQQDPDFAANRQAIEQFTQQYTAQYPNGDGSRAVITIPVVVHVVYNTTVQNISTAQIQSQIDILNEDYQKLNPDWTSTPSAWQSLVANYQIQFCLASRDPNGNTTTGIIRKQTSSTSFSTNDNVKRNANGGDDAWPASSYLNIWVCNLSGGTLGYAQFPGGAAATDGVVIGYKYFGNIGTATSPYDLGRTATHEVGHWLNLYHIWGDDGTSCTGSDQVNDTPNQADQNYGCPNFPAVSCTNGPNGDMFMNYMDYTDDACMYMFTNGQYARSSSLFASGGSRAALLNSLGCQAITTPPVTNFTGSPTNTCTGIVQFTDLTTNGPTTWAWNFGDGTSATTQNPSHVYSTSGVYTVTLTTTNAYGSNPKTLTNYITVTKPAVPTASNVEKCGASSFTLSTSATGVSWFDSSGTKVSGLSNFVTPVLNQTTTYWVEDSVPGTTINVGPADNTIGAGGYFANSTDRYLTFDCYSACTLKSVLVYAQAAGTRVIALRNSAGTTLQSLSVNLTAGANTVNLNFNLPVGTNLQLAVNGTANLYRNSAGAVYPYTLSGLVSITNSNAGTAGYYYYFYNWIIQGASCISERQAVTAIVRPNVSATTTVTDAGCGANNGTIALNVATGTPTYSYIWNNGSVASSISSLAPGVYTATVTDSYACSATVSATVNGSNNLSIQVAPVNISCAGNTDGNIAITIPSGTPPYTYNWSNGATAASVSNLTAGSYSVTVADGTGCSTTSTQTITEPTGINLSVTPVNATCNGAANGSASLSVSGGTAGYTYLWSNNSTGNSLQNVTASTYSLTVYDTNQCSAVSTITITEPAALTASTTSTNLICFGNQDGIASVSAAGGTPGYTYQWSNGNITPTVTTLSAGTTTVTVTDANGCTVSSSFVVSQPDLIEVAVTAVNTASDVNNGSATIDSVMGGNAPFTYFWNNGSIINSISNVGPGVYTVTVTDNLGCTGTTSVVVAVNPVSGINELNNQTFRIYPNPATSELTIELLSMNAGEGTMLSLKNVLGQTLLNRTILSVRSKLDISNFDNGVYLIEIIQGNRRLPKQLIISR